MTMGRHSTPARHALFGVFDLLVLDSGELTRKQKQNSNSSFE